MRSLGQTNGDRGGVLNDLEELTHLPCAMVIISNVLLCPLPGDTPFAEFDAVPHTRWGRSWETLCFVHS